MSGIGQSERATQNRVIALFRDELNYRYLGDWTAQCGLHRIHRDDGWRGIQAREQVIKGALYAVLQDPAEVERIFLIVKQQKEY